MFKTPHPISLSLSPTYIIQFQFAIFLCFQFCPPLNLTHCSPYHVVILRVSFLSFSLCLLAFWIFISVPPVRILLSCFKSSLLPPFLPSSAFTCSFPFLSFLYWPRKLGGAYPEFLNFYLSFDLFCWVSSFSGLSFFRRFGFCSFLVYPGIWILRCLAFHLILSILKILELDRQD